MEKELKLQITKTLDNFYMPIKDGKQSCHFFGEPVEIGFDEKENLLIVDIHKWFMAQTSRLTRQP